MNEKLVEKFRKDIFEETENYGSTFIRLEHYDLLNNEISNELLVKHLASLLIVCDNFFEKFDENKKENKKERKDKCPLCLRDKD